jgi:hypothetical protein
MPVTFYIGDTETADTVICRHRTMSDDDDIPTPSSSQSTDEPLSLPTSEDILEILREDRGLMEPLHLHPSPHQVNLCNLYTYYPAIPSSISTTSSKSVTWGESEYFTLQDYKRAMKTSKKKGQSGVLPRGERWKGIVAKLKNVGSWTRKR